VILTRTGGFAFRERVWEADGSSPTGGHTHIRSLLVLALAGSYFLARLAKNIGIPSSQGFALRMDLEGMSGRGIVASNPNAPLAGILDEPERLSSESRVAVTVSTTVADVLADPVRVGLELVGEVALVLSPDLAGDAALRRHLKANIEVDKSSRFPQLGFVTLPKK
jgi:hypothetical protein